MKSLQRVGGWNIGEVIGDVSLKGDEAVLALAKCFQSAPWSNLKTLDLRGTRVGDAGVAALAQASQSGHFSNLHTLHLAWTKVGDAGAAALAQASQSGHFINLHTLNLKYTEVGDAGVAALAQASQSGHFSNLHTLNLEGTQVGDAGVVALAQASQSGHFINLHTLHLAGTKVGDAGVAALAQASQSGHFINLHTLNLELIKVGDAGVAALAEACQSGHFSNLQELSLKRTEVGDAGVAALAQASQSGHFSTLWTLDLALTKVGDAGVAALAQACLSGHFINLHTLNLRWTKVGDAGVEALAEACQSGHFSNLHTLHLGCRTVGDAGVAALAQASQSGHLSNLHTLNLQGAKLVGDAGVAALAQASQSGHFSNLHTLHLEGTKVGDAGVAALAQASQSGHFSNLHTLNLGWTEVGDAGVAALAQASQSGHFSNLHTLNLQSKNMGNAGVAALAQASQSGHFSNLQELDLGFSQVGEVGVAALAKALGSNDFRKLRLLNLSGNSAKDEGIVEMARTLKSGNLPSLQELWLCNPGVAWKISQGAERALVSAYEQNKLLVVQIPDSSAAVQRLQERNERRVTILRKLQGEPNLSGNHGKVFLCGNPNAGKTTLRRTLVQSKFAWLTSGRSRKEERTRGIELSYIGSKKEFSDGRPLILAVWDLAGQSEYHVLHSTFMPDLAFADGQATFFVIVCSTVNNIECAENELLYWLKFIASNSVTSVDEKQRRQVLVVVNCFEGNPGEHDQKEWTKILEECSEKFAKFLHIITNPFILNATVRHSVKSFKSELKRMAKEMLRSRLMPQICLRVQEETKKWASKNSEYPVLPWKKYSSMLFGVFNEEKLKPATEYLHEAGHLILFKKGALEEGGLPDDTLVILDPEWFCQKVVGHLLLPETMVRPGETSLGRKMALDGSLPKSVLQRRLQIRPEKVDEVVAILLRLGLCYHSGPGADNIFVPALIKSGDKHDWMSATVEKGWVMGFSLALKDSATTVFPMSLFRKLQVLLAKDLAIGPDCHYVSGHFHITFRSKEMFVLVEFCTDLKESQPDRLDILVKPLVDDPEESNNVDTRQRQVELAQDIVEKVVGISRDCCPGVELVRKIVHPWISSMDKLPPPEKRDVAMSAEDVIARIKKHEPLNWTVGKVVVKNDELLSQGDLQELKEFLEDRCDLMREILNEFRLPYPEKQVGVSGRSKFSDSEGNNQMDLESGKETGDSNYELWKEMRELGKEVRELRKETRDGFHDIRDGIYTLRKEIRDGFHKVLQQHKSLVLDIQSLERFSIQEKERSVPRFAYLTEVGKPTMWMRLSKALVHDLKLHFYCEAPHSGQTLHEVDGQAGVDITQLKDWTTKLAPVLDWSLKIAFFAVKIAGTALLPGLGVLIPEIPPLLKTSSQTTSALADLLKSSSTGLTSSLDRQAALDSQAESLAEGSSSKNSGDGTAIRGAARAAVKEVLDGLNSQEFKQQVGLRRVRISNLYGGTLHVVWICDKCFGKYGTKAKEV